MLHEYDSVTRNNGTSLIPSHSLSLNNNSLKFKEVPHKKLGAVVYTVKPGDTLWGISQLYLGTGKNYNEIQSINHLKDDTIHPGQTVLIPQNLSSGWILYNVESGDTLWNLAKTFLGSWTKYNLIMSLNNLSNETIYPGQILKIPIKNQSNVYIVQKSETLWDIAFKLLGDGNRYYDIISMNNLNSDQVSEGQKLLVPEI